MADEWRNWGRIFVPTGRGVYVGTTGANDWKHLGPRKAARGVTADDGAVHVEYEDGEVRDFTIEDIP